MPLIVPLNAVPSQTVGVQLNGRHFYVYLHRKKDTGEVFYVGKGKGKRAYSTAPRNRFWKFVVAKHGFTVEISDDRMTQAQAFDHERALIAQLRMDGAVLCNLTDGGEGGIGRIISGAERLLRAEIQREVWMRPGFKENFSLKMTGRKMSIGARQNMSASALGKIVTDVTRRKMSEAQTILNNLPERRAFSSRINKGRRHTEEAKKRISESKLGANNVLSKPVLCIETGVIFASNGEAMRWLKSIGKDKASQAAISRVCYGKKATAYGYRWSFICR
jgi:hypothetical protein